MFDSYAKKKKNNNNNNNNSNHSIPCSYAWNIHLKSAEHLTKKINVNTIVTLDIIVHEI